METVYIDLLVIINLYITYFLLKGVSVFLHRKMSAARSLFGSLTGGMSSLLILLPPMPFFLNIAVKIASCAVITLIAFGFKNRLEYLKNALFFIIINIVFAGFALLLWLFAAPFNMEYRNGYTYFNISFTALVVTTLLAYGLIKLLRFILDARSSGGREYTITIANRGGAVTLDALADSGNMLVDYFSGMSVIICGKKSVEAIIPDVLKNFDGDFNLDSDSGDYPLGIRFLPYNTINSSGVIPVFKVEKITVKTDGRPDKNVRALIGVTVKNDGKAIFNPKILL